MKKKTAKTIAVVFAGIVLVAAGVNLLLNRDVVIKDPSEKSFIEQLATAIQGPKDNVHIGGREIEYEPGEYGRVVTQQIDESEFSSKKATQDYRENWHEQSWKGEVPKSGRDRTAHYESDENVEWVANEIIVAFSDQTSRERIKQIAESKAWRIGGFLDNAELSHHAALLYDPEETEFDPLAEADKLQADYDEIAAAFPNVVMYASHAANDPGVEKQTYLRQSKFNIAWNNAMTAEGTTIAVLDSGIDMDHEDLRDNIDYEHAKNTVDSRPMSSSFTDVCGHGTVVSGIAAATANNGKGIAGCSLNAEIMPVKILDDAGKGSVFRTAGAMEWLCQLEEKPDVVNMSFGHEFSSWFQLPDQIIFADMLQGYIAELSDSYGTVFVAAVGNSGEGDNTLAYPAALYDVIGVGSVDSSGAKSSFSSTNETVDICAQGEDIYSTTDPSGAFGIGGFYSESKTVSDALLGDNEEPLKGTSFAAPQVSAAAAMLRAQHPSWSAIEIEKQLESTATDCGAQDYDTSYGYGILNVAAACEIGAGAESGSGTGTNVGSNTGAGTDSGKAPALGGSIKGAYREISKG